MAKRQAGPEITALAQYEEELAALAQAAADQEAGVGGGQFFSVLAGELSFGGAPIPGNKMVVIVLDSVIANLYYPGDFNADQAQSPACYAFGRDEKTLAPHPEAAEPQADGCASCAQNQFGTAERGRGKACSNRRRLALISAGEIQDGEVSLYTEPEHFETTEVGLLQLPVMSVPPYAQWVKGLADSAGKRLPPCAVYALCKVVKDQRTQFKVLFETIEPVPSALIKTVLARRQQVSEQLAFPFPKREEAPAAAPTRAPRRAPTRSPPLRAQASAPPRPAGRPSSGAKTAVVGSAKY